MKKVKVLFADLDGTLIVPKSSKEFPKDADDWKFKENVMGKICELVGDELEYIHIITNQGGVDLGYARPSDMIGKFEKVTNEMIVFFAHEYSLDTCPQHSWDVAFAYKGKKRKPGPQMINDWLDENSDAEIDRSECLMIGDMDSDRECAEGAGVNYMDVQEFVKQDDFSLIDSQDIF